MVTKNLFQRRAEVLVKKLATYFPCIGITGPRQSGKSTLARMAFPSYPYVSFENPDVQMRAREDFRRFLQEYSEGAIFDEVQHVPELLSYMQEAVDLDERPGRFVVTSSQNLVFSSTVSQSLAGRIGMVTLLPFAQNELPKEGAVEERIIQGGYPRLVSQNIEPDLFYPSYFSTYVQRDVLLLKAIEKIPQFQKFIRLCAGRVGQIINYQSLAVDCDVSRETVKEWLHVLQATYVIFLLQPFHTNFNKRLIKMPKLYFYDTGFAAWLLSIPDADTFSYHHARGALVENFAVLELIKERYNKGQEPNLYFWRDRMGREVDLIAEWGPRLTAIEIKAGATYRSDFTKGLSYFSSIAQQDVDSYVVYMGSETMQAGDVTCVPLEDVAMLE
jgi:predicted AAA+ superfamily ATPase